MSGMNDDANAMMIRQGLDNIWETLMTIHEELVKLNEPKGELNGNPKK